MRRIHILLGLLSLITLSCMTVAGWPILYPKPTLISLNVSPASSKTPTFKPTLTPFQPITNTPSSSPTLSPEPGQEPTLTVTPRPKPAKKTKPTSEPTSEWAFHDAGEVTAPILLYHHVSPGDPPNIYSVSADTFSEQMDYLKSEGYTAIPISLLVKAIREGSDLPERPVVITFDDGNVDIYENAFPIMQKYGFSGTLYLVMNYLDHDTFLSSDQAAEMAQAGWEIGSHSMSHPDVTGMQSAITYQVVNSKKELVEAIGAPVNTFAYPYGQINADILSEVMQEYTAAVGLGDAYTHSMATIYYLDRIEVRSDTDLTTFANSLPW